MAISKKRKNELVNQYADWANQSKAMFMTEYPGSVDETNRRITDEGARSRR